MKNTQTDITNHFVEQMGLIAQGDGLPRIAGQIMGLLLIEDGPFSFAEIAQRLSISRASVSTNTRLLEGLRIIERVSKVGERGDFFQYAKNPYANLLQGVMQRMEKASLVVTEARNALTDTKDKSRKRLADLDTFYSEYRKSTSQLIKQLSKG